MGYTISQQSADIILITFIGDLSIEEISEANVRIHDEILVHTQQPTYIVSDVQKLRRFPLNLGGMITAYRPISKHPNMAAIINISLSHPLMNFLATSLYYIAHITAYNVDTYDEAYALIETLRKNPLRTHR